MEIERRVKKSDCFDFVSLQAPLKLCLKESMVIRAFTLRLANLKQEFKLLCRIIILLLLDPALDHTIKGQKLSLVIGASFLVRHVGSLMLAL